MKKSISHLTGVMFWQQEEGMLQQWNSDLVQSIFKMH